jgi:hypothetical protein
VHKHVQHGLGTCWRCSSSLHRMYILLCFLLLVTGFYPVWFGHCGFLEMKKLAWRSGEGQLRHASRWCTEIGLRTGSKMAHVLCRHVVPGVGSVGSPGFYTVCKPNAPPRGTVIIGIDEFLSTSLLYPFSVCYQYLCLEDHLFWSL